MEDSPATASDLRHPYEAFGDQLATRLLSVEAMVTQWLSATATLLADLAARVATLESPSTPAPRTTPAAEQMPTERTPSLPADHLSEEKLLILVAQLRSTAAELLNCLPRVGRSTYNDLICALEARFGDAPF
ncbi:hypothetical protein HPB52_023081 [Rhipicephalus sanguineus]|uniref:Uncharacterized protein n=1 Tax=Rhipicephalus sanguineus TaxID=34632 RepID=A0A9D4TBZ7_RHISA|nr:hypothetical protein HPB52_023081 [Rhipicephalus sanguineus]